MARFSCPKCDKVLEEEEMVNVEGEGLVCQACASVDAKSDLDDLRGLEGLTAEEIDALQEASIAAAVKPSEEGAEAKAKAEAKVEKKLP